MLKLLRFHHYVKNTFIFLPLFFAGAISEPARLAASLLLMAACLLAGSTGLYLLLNLAYSVQLKHVAILGITVIAIGFVLQLFIGSAVTWASRSMWIIAMTYVLYIKWFWRWVMLNIRHIPEPQFKKMNL